MILWSASARGFFDSSIHGDAVPGDAVEISAELHVKLLDEQAAGATIQADVEGLPCACLPAAPTLDALRSRAIDAVKREAEGRILAIAPLWRQINDQGELAAAAFQLASASATTIDPAPPLARRLRINAVRSASNALEATITGMTAAALATFSAADAAHWPEA